MFDSTTSIVATLSRVALAAILSATVLFAAVAPAMAAAQDNVITVQVRIVHIGDLDLNKSSDQAALKQRVANVSRIVCTDLPAKGLDNSGGFSACYLKAMAGATKQVKMAIASSQQSIRAATAQ